MSLRRATILTILAVSTLLPALAVRAQEQAPPHIRRAQTFLVAWGHQKWDELKSVAAVQSGSFGIGKGGLDVRAALFWAFVGVPLAWGVWKTLESAAKIF